MRYVQNQDGEGTVCSQSDIVCVADNVLGSLEVVVSDDALEKRDEQGWGDKNEKVEE